MAACAPRIDHLRAPVLALPLEHPSGVLGGQSARRFEIVCSQADPRGGQVVGERFGPSRTDLAHQTLSNQSVKCADSFLDRRGRVEAVNLVQVDVIELQPLQAALHAVEDVAARRTPAVRAGRGVAEDLGGDDQALAGNLQVLQRLRRDLL